ncbi:zinc transporter ZIP14-like, partial [Paramuricea clavata]
VGSCSSSAYFHTTYSKNDGLHSVYVKLSTSSWSLEKFQFEDQTRNNFGKTEHFLQKLLQVAESNECCVYSSCNRARRASTAKCPEEAWGYGILFVTVISLGSLLGAVVVPFMASNLFQTILMAMISLAVGVLSGSGIFHLIPHCIRFTTNFDFIKALQLGHKDLSYMWKLVMVAVGIYIFFLLESVMKMYLYFKTLNSSIPFLTLPNLGCPNHECLWVKLRPYRLPREISCIIACVLYNRPLADNNELYEYIIVSLDKILLQNPGAGVIVMDDFNQFDTKRLCRNSSLKQIVKKPTRGKATLDLILTNIKRWYKDSDIVPAIRQSDHMSIMLYDVI